ncbi:hypothetical protein PVAP13_2KG475200 [Panicum virgatum]|uniref:Uncharacterized protein n=1 Tax=Panicum virgatum TaxID=38727 RepID=A0A8T0WFQ0_PANVG|nr:hypothetical protein PVAP13_2KG475200 [Panicum virgatum]
MSMCTAQGKQLGELPTVGWAIGSALLVRATLVTAAMATSPLPVYFSGDAHSTVLSVHAPWPSEVPLPRGQALMNPRCRPEAAEDASLQDRLLLSRGPLLLTMNTLPWPFPLVRGLGHQVPQYPDTDGGSAGAQSSNLLSRRGVERFWLPLGIHAMIYASLLN